MPSTQPQNNSKPKPNPAVEIKWWNHTPNYFTTVFWHNSLFSVVKRKASQKGVSCLSIRQENNVISTGSLTNTWNYFYSGFVWRWSVLLCLYYGLSKCSTNWFSTSFTLRRSNVFFESLTWLDLFSIKEVRLFLSTGTISNPNTHPTFLAPQETNKTFNWWYKFNTYIWHL